MDTNFLDADYAVAASESILVYAYILIYCFRSHGFFSEGFENKGFRIRGPATLRNFAGAGRFFDIDEG
jgi:hypothetical protein